MDSVQKKIDQARRQFLKDADASLEQHIAEWLACGLSLNDITVDRLSDRINVHIKKQKVLTLTGIIRIDGDRVTLTSGEQWSIGPVDTRLLNWWKKPPPPEPSR